MKLLVTGSLGMLGRDLTTIAKEQGYTVKDYDFRDEDQNDITNYKNLSQVCEQFKPNYLLHLAALTDVDECERSPDKAYLINTIGTQNCVSVCLKFDIPLVYVSTGSVFNGKKCNSYTEFDSPDPQNVYADSKYQGELIIASHLQKYTILRAGWMFGGKGEDKKFVAKILDLALKTKELRIVDDKYGSPTYTRDFARGMLYFVKNNLFGLFHLVNEGSVSRFEEVQKIFEFARIQDITITPVSSAYFPLPAPRPRMEALKNYKLELMNIHIMPTWQNALKEYVDEIIKEPIYSSLFK